MSNQTLSKLVVELSNLTVLEMAELKTLLEEKWGVQAAAASVAVAAAPVAVEAVEEATEFDVILEAAPADKKIGVIKIVRELTGLGLKEAKDLVEAAPKTVKEKAGKAESQEMVKKLIEAGAKASAKGV